LLIRRGSDTKENLTPNPVRMRHPGFEGLLTGHTLLDRYHVEEVIGRGGFAAVYRATDERLGRTVAVKVITRSGGGGEIQRRFQREARAIASLHHPNVVTVFDFGTDPKLGLDFLVMELLQGEVLSERLRRPEPMPVAQALRILLDAAAGVDAGHRAGLVHRDIKPGNIFLARNEPRGGFRVYVLDFGIARFTEPDATQLTHSGGALLSPAYAAPEQLRGERQVTPAADVFSLGVIGYQMLAREKPFPRDRLSAPGEAAAVVPLRERNPEVPAEIAEVIHRAMADDPAKRFPDAGAFARALMDAHSAPDPASRMDAVPAVRMDGPHTEGTEKELPGDEPIVPAVGAVPEPAPEPVRVEAAPAPVPVARVDPAPRVEEARRDPPRHPEGGVAVRTGGARRMSPALIAIPLLLVLGLVAWLVAGRNGHGDGDRVAERTPPPAATPPASDPSAGAAGTGTSAASPSASASPSPASPSSANPSAVSPSRPAVPVAPPAVAGAQPLTVAFAVRRSGGAWRRLAVDDAPPYRAFLDPARFRRDERVELVAVARSLDGRTAVSAPTPFRIRTR